MQNEKKRDSQSDSFLTFIILSLFSFRDSKNITLKDMCRKGLIRERDVIVYKRNFSACKVVVSKSMTVSSFYVRCRGRKGKKNIFKKAEVTFFFWGGGGGGKLQAIGGEREREERGGGGGGSDKVIKKIRVIYQWLFDIGC